MLPASDQTNISESELRVVVDGYTGSGQLRRYPTASVQHAFVGRVGLERHGVTDRESAGVGVTVPGE